LALGAHPFEFRLLIFLQRRTVPNRPSPDVLSGARPHAAESTRAQVRGGNVAEGEAEREEQREEFMGKLRAVGKNPRAAL
jgi:hypothetical protein